MQEVEPEATRIPDPREQLRRTYLAYVDAFNAHDWKALERYLAPDLVFDWSGDMDDLIGRDAMFAFYREAWSYFDERIEARVTEIEGNRLTAWIETELHVRRDWPDCPITPMSAGEVRQVRGEVRYVFREGRIVHIG